MKKSLLHKLSCSIAVALPMVMSTNSKACGTGGSTITNLPAFGFGGYQVYALNPKGKLTGFFYTASQPPHAFVYDSGALADLGTLGGAVSIGYAMNSSGQVAGRADLPSESHAFLYSGAGLNDLGTLGGSYSSAWAINEAGQVAGESYVTGDAGPIAFLYANGSMMNLGTLGSNYSSAFALNNLGLVIGESGVASSEVHAFAYSGGTMSDLGTLGGTYSSAFAVNDTGLIAGESFVASGDTHAFVYSGAAMTDLGTFGGTYSSAFVVNTNSQVAGVATTTNDQETHGFLYDHGTMVDLGTLGGNYSSIWALNNLGQIVGDSALADGTQHAFLWQKGSMVDLNSLLPSSSGWQLISAQLINDAGRIVGYGSYAGRSQWFVMDLVAGNNAPVAVAGPNQTVECQAQVTLDGSASSDPDHDTLTFEWSLGGVVLGNSAVLVTSLPLGANVLTLTVSDTCGASNQANVTVTVVDTTPPAIVTVPSSLTVSAGLACQGVVPNVLPDVVATDNCTLAEQLSLSQSPVAGALLGTGQYTIVVTARDSSGNSSSANVALKIVDTTAPSIVNVPAPITVSAGANCQGVVPNVLGNVVASDNCTPAAQLVLSQHPAPGTQLPRGQYVISVTVTDLAGNTSSAGISLIVADTTPPVIQSLSASPNSLSPPNHQIVAVTISAVVCDNCDSAPVSKIVSVTSNESLAPGDVQITGNLTVNLTATREPSGNGRVYIITVQSTDASGNVSTGTVSVVVPKGNGNGSGSGTAVVKK